MQFYFIIYLHILTYLVGGDRTAVRQENIVQVCLVKSLPVKTALHVSPTVQPVHVGLETLRNVLSPRLPRHVWRDWKQGLTRESCSSLQSYWGRPCGTTGQRRPAEAPAGTRPGQLQWSDAGPEQREGPPLGWYYLAQYWQIPLGRNFSELLWNVNIVWCGAPPALGDLLCLYNLMSSHSSAGKLIKVFSRKENEKKILTYWTGRGESDDGLKVIKHKLTWKGYCLCLGWKVRYW